MVCNYIFRINLVLKEIFLTFCVSFHLAEKMAGMVSPKVPCFFIPFRKLEQLVHVDARHSIMGKLQLLQEYEHKFLTPFANI